MNTKVPLKNAEVVGEWTNLTPVEVLKLIANNHVLILSSQDSSNTASCLWLGDGDYFYVSYQTSLESTRLSGVRRGDFAAAYGEWIRNHSVIEIASKLLCKP